MRRAGLNVSLARFCWRCSMGLGSRVWCTSLNQPGTCSLQRMGIRIHRKKSARMLSRRRLLHIKPAYTSTPDESTASSAFVQLRRFFLFPFSHMASSSSDVQSDHFSAKARSKVLFSSHVLPIYTLMNFRMWSFTRYASFSTYYPSSAWFSDS